MEKRILATVNRLFPPVANMHITSTESRSYAGSVRVNKELLGSDSDVQGSKPLSACFTSRFYGLRLREGRVKLAVAGSYTELPSTEQGTDRAQNVIMCKTEDSDELCRRLLATSNLGPLWVVPMNVLFHLDLIVSRMAANSTIVIEDTGAMTLYEAYTSYFTRNHVLPDTRLEVSSRCNDQVIIFVEPPKWLPMVLLTRVPDHESIKLYNSADEVIENVATVLSLSCTRMESLFSLGCIACPQAENCAKYLCGTREISPAISSDRLTRALHRVSTVIPVMAANSVRRSIHTLCTSGKLPKYIHHTKGTEVHPVDTSIPYASSIFSSIMNAEEDILNSRVEAIKEHQGTVKRLSDLRDKCHGCALKETCYYSLDTKRSGVERRSSADRLSLLEEVCIGPVTNIDELRDSLDAKLLLRNALVATVMTNQEDLLGHDSTTSNLTVNKVDELVNELFSPEVKKLLPLYRKYVNSPIDMESRRLFGFLPRSVAKIMAGYNVNGRAEPLMKPNSGGHSMYQETDPHDLYSARTVLSFSPGHRLFTSIAGDSKLYAVYRSYGQASLIAAPVHAIGQLDSAPFQVSNSDMMNNFFATVATLVIGAAKYRFGSFGSSTQAVPLTRIKRKFTLEKISAPGKYPHGRPTGGMLDILLYVAEHSDYSCVGIRVMRAIKETLNASKA